VVDRGDVAVRQRAVLAVDEVHLDAVVDVVEVDGGGDDPLVERLDGEDGLDAAGSAQEVTRHGLGGRHQRVGADGLGHGLHLDDVARGGRGGVRVDVLDV